MPTATSSGSSRSARCWCQAPWRRVQSPDGNGREPPSQSVDGVDRAGRCCLAADSVATAGCGRCRCVGTLPGVGWLESDLRASASIRAPRSEWAARAMDADHGAAVSQASLRANQRASSCTVAQEISDASFAKVLDAFTLQDAKLTLIASIFLAVVGNLGS